MEKILQEALAQGWTDLHLSAGGIYARKDGQLDRLAGQVLPEGAVSAFFKAQLPAQPPDGKDFSLTYAGQRIRVHQYDTFQGKAWALRLLPGEVPALQNLHLPACLPSLLAPQGGLVLVTGPTGSGKSTTLAALLADRAKQGGHLMTFERPVEYIIPSHRALVTQVELTEDQALGPLLAGALRADPDVVMIGEIRTTEAAKGALYLAETGHLVLSTLHSADVVQALMRLVHLVPANERPLWQGVLAEVLCGVVSQRLVPKATGQGRVPVAEVLVRSDGLVRQIRDGAWSLVAQSLENQAVGTSLEGHMADQIRQGYLDPVTAYQITAYPERLTMLLEQEKRTK
ncbi:type IV pilus twitching motility protein PilT [Peptococcus simiae]|uniref:type IV pilus twitching motility protein PilT n=1 Tax=Peptococcus simiae TaxID=1643805 RepID=UPI00397F08F9